MITDHTLRVLEYDRVLREIADRTASALGRESALALRPMEDSARLHHERALISESLQLHLSSRGFPSSAHDDIRAPLDAARVAGSLLEPADLLGVARMLRVVREVKRTLADEGVGERLRDLGEALVDSRDLESRITHALGPDGEILDSASPRLGKLRRQAFATRESLRQRLESFLKNLEIRPDGEGYVTFRSGRYVVPVPAGDRGRVRGIVHDQSASGHTLFVEPFAVVDENNALARAEIEAREEERRILVDLSDRVREFIEPLREDIRVLGRLDFCRAVASMAAELRMIMPDLAADGASLRLVRARHPLLLAESANRDAVVPLDVALEGETRMLILTGPNMGGKTVALKTLGLSSLMAISGLPVSAEPGTTFPTFRTVAADIGDEQSISQNLSTFASHLKYLGEFLERKEEPALVLLDELGTGTDPSEGAALATAYLEALEGAGTFVVATTHLSQLKDFAARHPRAVNGAMAFDESTLSPLFSLHVGTPGRSRAIEVATRLAFPARVLERARSLLSEDEQRMDRLLAEVEQAREHIRLDEARIRETAEETARRLREAEERETRAESMLREARSRASAEADQILKEADALVKETRKKLVEARPAPAAVEESGRQVREKRREAAASMVPRPEHGADYPRIEAGEVRAGVEVWSIDLGSVVTADETPNARGEVHVTKKGIRFRMSVDRLRRPPGRSQSPPKKSGGVTTTLSANEAVPTELDLRGMTGPDAVQAVEQYIDAALLAGVGIVRIIHGKGTGVLRQRVTEVLGRHFGVLRHRPGEGPEGGAGVTIAYLGER